jgi:hypothetical protein
MDAEESRNPFAGKPRPPGVLLCALTLGLVVTNIVMGYSRGIRNSHDASYAIGSAVSSVLLPILAIAVFSVARRFRNPRSQLMIVFWSSVIVLVIALATMGR